MTNPLSRRPVVTRARYTNFEQDVSQQLEMLRQAVVEMQAGLYKMVDSMAQTSSILYEIAAVLVPDEDDQ